MRATTNLHSATDIAIKVAADGYDIDCQTKWGVPCIALQVGATAGDIKVITIKGETVTIPSVPAGARIDLQVKKVLNTGTTASPVYVLCNNYNK
jgi:hypothetical protein